jgi:MYXO-CTERM domain-containing protein
MHNTGNTAWSDGENILFTYDGGERMDAPEQVMLGGASVAPDGRHTFELTLVAPAEPGEHAVLLRMDRYGTSRFGAVAEVRILAELPPVDPDAGTPPPTDAGTDPELPPDAGTIDPGGDASMGTRTGDRSFSGDDATLTGGCSAGGAGGEGRAPAWAALTLVAAIALRRRRG